MALSLATGSAQTTAGASLTPFYLPIASYPVSERKVGETNYKNTSGTIDMPNTIRLASSIVPNMFSKTAVTPADGQELRGVSMLAQVLETWTVNDAADELPTLYYPASAHLVVKVPSDALVTSTVVADLVRRLLGVVLRDNDDTLATMWNNMLHGITEF